MQFITKYDVGQYLILDNDITKVVLLIEVAGNGWGTVKLKDGTIMAVDLVRLTPRRAEIMPATEKIEDSVRELPQKDTIESIKVKFKTKDGGSVIKTLHGKDAEQWHTWIQEVCALAELYKLNPEWLSLDWKITKQR